MTPSVKGKKLDTKQLTLLITLIVLLSVALFTVSILFFCTPVRVIAVIGGQKVETAEFELVMSRNNAVVKAEFLSDHSLNDIDFDWYKTYGEQRPVDVLTSKTADALQRIKVIHRLAKENGIISQTEYHVIVAKMHAENKALAEAIKNGELVYGKTKWTEREYYDYYNSTLEASLSSRLSAGKMAVSDSDARAYYDQKRSESSNPQSFEPFEGNEVIWKNTLFGERFNELIEREAQNATVEYKVNVKSYRFQI